MVNGVTDKSGSNHLNAYRFRIVDQRRGDYLNIYDIKKDVYIIQHAADLARTPKMIQQFFPEDAMLIGYITGGLNTTVFKSKTEVS